MPRDWSHYDATVESVARSGTHVLGLLIGSPRFAAPRPTDPPRSKKNVGRWRSFVRDVVRRYGDGGSFWAENPDVPYDPVRSWQVWNEPNYPRFWFERPQARQYARFLRQTSPVIRQADPKASIVMGGLPNVASSSGGVRARMEDYLDELYSSSKRVRRYFDVVAIHPYAVDHKGVVAALRRVRMVMNRHGDRRAPIWITEFGWATFSRGFTATSSAGQAKRLTQSFRALARVRRRYRLRGVIWYAWRDAPAVTRDWWGLHCGLFTVDDQAKPAWRAFTRFTRRAL